MYERVIPRDLFNEANYMKCLGQLALILHDHPLPNIELTGSYFECGMDLNQNIDGDLYTDDLVLSNSLSHVRYVFYRPLNSREAWPIQIYSVDHEMVDVFTNEGKLSPEFLAAINKVECR